MKCKRALTYRAKTCILPCILYYHSCRKRPPPRALPWRPDKRDETKGKENKKTREKKTVVDDFGQVISRVSRHCALLAQFTVAGTSICARMPDVRRFELNTNLASSIRACPFVWKPVETAVPFGLQSARFFPTGFRNGTNYYNQSIGSNDVKNTLYQ